MNQSEFDTRTRYLGYCAASALSSIDEEGSTSADLRLSYQRLASNGMFGVSELSRGQSILLRLGLTYERDTLVVPTPFALSLRIGAIDHVSEVIAAMLSRTSLSSAFLHSSDDSSASPTVLSEDLGLANGVQLDREWLGDLGEEHVLGELRRLYASWGWVREYPSIRRVSLVSDSFGYDIEASIPSGGKMALEVKTSSLEVNSEFVFYISRNEYEVSQSMPCWRLVFCDFSQKQCSIAGWTFGRAIRELCPSDSTYSRWESAQVKIRRVHLHPGIESLMQSFS